MAEGLLEGGLEVSLPLLHAASEELEAGPDLGNVRYLEGMVVLDDLPCIVNLRVRREELGQLRKKKKRFRLKCVTWK